MYHYNLQQWLMFFFLYCFFGWCWETCYVSAKKRHWVNRGFMKGPFLPIYGFGALVVLISTLPVRSMPVLVYLFGMLGATLLELVTGICMEKLFHVRYWDYSSQKFHYKGHICLSSSLAWGVFSLAMIYGFHKPVERLVLFIPAAELDILTTFLTVIVAADFAISFKTAMELRDILDNMEHIKNEMKRLQKRAEVMEAFLANDIQEAKENIKDEIQERTGAFMEDMQERKDNWLEDVSEYKENFIGEMHLKKEEVKEQLVEIRKKQQYYMLKAKNAMPKNTAIIGLLKRNPTAVSKQYGISLKEYKDHLIESIKKEVSEFTDRD